MCRSGIRGANLGANLWVRTFAPFAPGMGLSRRGYARHRKQHGLPGTSDTAVRAAISDGRIAAAVLADKTIDPEKADALWGTNSSRSPSDGDGVSEVPVNGNGASQGSELTQARVRKTDLDAQKAEC